MQIQYGDLIDISFVGNIVSIDIDALNGDGVFKVSDLVQVQPKKVEEDD